MIVTASQTGSVAALSAPPGQLYIGGEWVHSNSRDRLPSINPSTGEAWTEIPAGDAADVDAAAAAAAAAFRGPWAKLAPTGRGKLLRALASAIRRDATGLAELESIENGRAIRDTQRGIAGAAATLEYYAGFADKIEGASLCLPPHLVGFTSREPLGVVAAIVPWNSPLALACCKLGPALACGNTVIVKPSEVAASSILALGRLLDEVECPAGVVNIISGLGGTVGSALVTHPDVRKVSLTGSHETARLVMEQASRDLTRVAFECGGKSPHIIFGDADLERAIPIAARAAFRSTGQSCSLGSRLMVERVVYEEVLERIAQYARGIQIGPATESTTDIGPQASADQLAKTHRYIELGRASGNLVTGGGTPDVPDCPDGYYVEPTIFDEIPDDSPVVQDEIFGPVLCARAFDTEEEAVALGNGTRYGLTAGIWTRDVGRAHRMAKGLDAGLVSVNCYRPSGPSIPYGGRKYSGIGRENGLDALYEYSEVKSIVLDVGLGDA